MTATDPAILSRPLRELPDPLPIPRLTRQAGEAPVHAVIRPPGSKSLTNRVLLLAALADGESRLSHPLLEADDAERMLAAIRTLGAETAREPDGGLRVRGVGGCWRVPPEGTTVNLNNAGTATRFLAASALASPAPVTIDGNERMRQRPIAELSQALRALGATVEHLGDPNCPPVRITPPPERALLGATMEIGRTASSQYVSALLLTAPALPEGLTLRLTEAPTSASYIRMTIDLLEEVGVRVRTSEDMRTIRVGPGLTAFDHDVEADASGATYFWAAAALLEDAFVGVQGVRDDSTQGDAEFPDLLQRMGASVGGGQALREGVWVRGGATLEPILADMADMPDAAVTLAVCCAFARGASIVRGVRTLRVKECDRLEALRSELAKIGVRVETEVQGDPDVMTVTPPDGGVDCSESAAPVEFETFDDHRMAMALSLVGLRRPNVLIKDPPCVAKTYPTFFADLAKLY